MKLWIIIIAAGVVTFLMRFLPMNSPFFHRMKIFKHEAFAILPLCLLAALIGPNFLAFEKNPFDVSSALLIGVAVTIWVCLKSRSTIAAAVAGYASFICLNILIKKL